MQRGSLSFTHQRLCIAPLSAPFILPLFSMYTYTTLSLFTSISAYTGRPYLPGATSPIPNKQDTCREYYTVPSAQTLQCHPRRYEPHYHGTDTHIQSHREKKTGAKSLLTRKELINGGAIMKWRHQGA